MYIPIAMQTVCNTYWEWSTAVCPRWPILAICSQFQQCQRSGGHRKRYKDALKANLAVLDITCNSAERVWRHTGRDGVRYNVANKDRTVPVRLIENRRRLRKDRPDQYIHLCISMWRVWTDLRLTAALQDRIILLQTDTQVCDQRSVASTAQSIIYFF